MRPLGSAGGDHSSRTVVALRTETRGGRMFSGGAWAVATEIWIEQQVYFVWGERVKYKKLYTVQPRKLNQN